MFQKRVMTSLLAGSFLFSSLAVGKCVHHSHPFDLPLADNEKLINMLKKSGKLSATATTQEEKQALSKYLANKKAQFNSLPPGEWADLANKRSEAQKQRAKNFSSSKNNLNDRIFTDQLTPLKPETYNGSVTTDRILAILVDFPDYLHNTVTQESTDMYYEDYHRQHYQDLLFSPTGYEGPNGENLLSMRQFYKAQSGSSYAVNGKVVGWYTASKSARYYGANANSQGARELVREALEAAAKEIDLSWFDQEDRYDYDNDGNYREPDGVIDHLMIFHASVGEEAGGGDLGEDAIWSHRWDLGDVFVIPGSNNNSSDRYQGKMAAYDYTIQPIDAAAGVTSHEYGHDLGLPDEYDTEYSGKGEPVSYWSVMSSGSWAGLIPGTEPTGFSPYAREFLQANIGGNWLKGTSIDVDTITPWGMTFFLDQASSKGTHNDYLRINLPDKRIHITAPASGHYAYYSDRGDNLNNTMTVSLPLTKTNQPKLTFKTWYEIEEGYDYARVLVDGKPIAGNITVDFDPNGIGFGIGVTGSSGGWIDAEFDLSQFAGQTVTLTFNYMTDSGVSRPGWFIDDIQVVDGNVIVLKDDVEGDSSSFEMAGFRKDPGYLLAKNYYLLEWRNHDGIDIGLAHINRGKGLMSFDPGLVIWYVDHSHTDNWVGVHPGEGFLGVVDQDQSVVHWKDGTVAETRYQLKDAAFGYNLQSSLNIERKGKIITDQARYSDPVFFDRLRYINDTIPDAGKKLPELGLTFEVTGQSEDQTVGRVMLRRFDDNLWGSTQ